MRKGLILAGLLFLCPYFVHAQGIVKNGGTGKGGGIITLSPVSVPPTMLVNPTTAVLPTTGTQQFTATITGDPYAKGVTWTLFGAGCTGSGCGTVSSSTSASGVAITYTAPSSTPTPGLVGLTATSNLNNSVFFTIPITISGAPPGPTVINQLVTLPNQTAASVNTWQLPFTQGNAGAVVIIGSSADTVSGAQNGAGAASTRPGISLVPHPNFGSQLRVGWN